MSAASNVPIEKIDIGPSLRWGDGFFLFLGSKGPEKLPEK
jgi:hypothetical protein